MAEQIIERKTIRDKFAAACRTNHEFDALEYVARELALCPAVVARVVADRSGEVAA